MVIRQQANYSTKTSDLNIQVTKQGWVIRSVILFSDTVFKGGSFVVHPTQSSSQVTIPIKHAKNSEEKIEIKILLGVGMNAPYFLVHEIKDFQLKRFSFFMPLS